MDMQNNTDTNLTNTNVSKLEDEQREALESLTNSRTAAGEWRIRITKEKVSYCRHREEVFFLCSTVSTCERAICHWNMTVGDDLDRRLMDKTVRVRRLSPAMKSTIEIAFNTVGCFDEIVKTGKTYLDVYAWAAETALVCLDEEFQEWDDDAVLGMAHDQLRYGTGRPVEISDARIEFVAAGLHANRAASEGRVRTALAALQ